MKRTGPITVFNKVIYDIIEREANPPNYLHFIGWVYLWGAIFHWITAILNCEQNHSCLIRFVFMNSFAGCNFLKYVTLFSCDTFGFYVAWVYLQYGVQVLTRQFPQDPASPDEQGALVGIILALLMVGTAFSFQVLSKAPVFHRQVRRFLEDYGMPISLVAASAMAYWGRFNFANPTTLPVGKAFQPASDREWLVRFWQLEGKWVGIALPFGIVLWILFFFDHNVSVREGSFLRISMGKCLPQSVCTVPDGSRFAISSPKTTRVPLGLFPPWNCHFHCRPVGFARAQRVDPTSPYPYNILVGDGSLA